MEVSHVSAGQGQQYGLCLKRRILKMPRGAGDEHTQSRYCGEGECAPGPWNQFAVQHAHRVGRCGYPDQAQVDPQDRPDQKGSGYDMDRFKSREPVGRSNYLGDTPVFNRNPEGILGAIKIGFYIPQGLIEVLSVGNPAPSRADQQHRSERQKSHEA